MFSFYNYKKLFIFLLTAALTLIMSGNTCFKRQAAKEQEETPVKCELYDNKPDLCKKIDKCEHFDNWRFQPDSKCLEKDTPKPGHCGELANNKVLCELDVPFNKEKCVYVNNACRPFADFDHSGFDNHGINWGTGTPINKDGLSRKDANHKAREARQADIDPRCFIRLKKPDDTYSIYLDELPFRDVNVGGEAVKWKLRIPAPFTDADEFLTAVEDRCMKFLGEIRGAGTPRQKRKELIDLITANVGGIDGNITNRTMTNFAEHDLVLGKFSLRKNAHDFQGAPPEGSKLLVLVYRKNSPLAVMTHLVASDEYRWKSFYRTGVRYENEPATGPGVVRSLIDAASREMKKYPKDELLPDTSGSIFARGDLETDKLNKDPVNLSKCLTRQQFEDNVPLADLKNIVNLNEYRNAPGTARKIAQNDADAMIDALPTGTAAEKDALKKEIDVYLDRILPFVDMMIAAGVHWVLLENYNDFKKDHYDFVDSLQKKDLLKGARDKNRIIKKATHTSLEIITKFVNLKPTPGVPDHPLINARNNCFENAGTLTARLSFIEFKKPGLPTVNFSYALLLTLILPADKINALNLVDLLALAKLDRDQTYFQNIIEQLGRPWRFLEEMLFEIPDPNLTEDENVRRIASERLTADLKLNTDENGHFVKGFRKIMPRIPADVSLAELKLVVQGPPPDADSFRQVELVFLPSFDNPTNQEMDNIKRWIEEVVVEQSRINPEFVADLYSYWTGSSAVPGNLRILLLSYMPGLRAGLIAHTCYYQLDILRTLDEESFKIGFIDAINAAASGEGFTTG